MTEHQRRRKKVDRCAQQAGSSVGFLGGTPVVHEALREVIARDFGGVDAAFWSPERFEVDSPTGSVRIAHEIRERGVDLLTVALGKPRQELWIQRYGRLTGSRVLLAFGASADFLAGRVERAPRWMQDNGLEWAYRLVTQPRRLGHRYVVEPWILAYLLVTKAVRQDPVAPASS